MEAQFRPYGMIINGADATASSVVLRDTGGDPLKCNFISVEASGENPDALYRAAFDSNSQTTPVAHYTNTVDSPGISTSGIVGGYASVNKGVVEFLLADCDRTDTVQLQLDQTGECIFFITYGQVQAGNRLRDNERPTGN